MLGEHQNRDDFFQLEVIEEEFQFKYQPFVQSSTHVQTETIHVQILNIANRPLNVGARIVGQENSSSGHSFQKILPALQNTNHALTSLGLGENDG